MSGPQFTATPCDMRSRQRLPSKTDDLSASAPLPRFRGWVVLPVKVPMVSVTLFRW